MNVSTGAETDIVGFQTGHLGQPQAGLHREQQQGMVAPPGPRLLVWRRKQSIDLRSGQVTHLGARVSLAGNRQNPLDLAGVIRQFEGGVLEE